MSFEVETSFINHFRKVKKSNKQIRWLFFMFFFIFYSQNVAAQNSVLINNFTKQHELAGNQNWGIDLDSAGNVFIANNRGLLYYNGIEWKLFQASRNKIIRSVAVINEVVYTGSFNEFGYWEKTENDAYKYHSLTGLLQNFSFNNDEIWRIAEHENKIYFQSFGSVFEYDFKTVKRLNAPGTVMLLLKINNRLFVQKIKEELYEIRNSAFHLVPGSQIFRGSEVKIGIAAAADTLIFGTGEGNLYTFSNQQFKPWKTELGNKLNDSKLNNALTLGDKIVLGTISNGLYVLNFQGKLLAAVNTDDNLQNNTILALAKNSKGDLWVGMDKGIDFVSFNSHISVYSEKQTGRGAVYSAALYNGLLYVGTNQGIYQYKPTADGKLQKLGMLKNSQGQVWFIQEIDGTLFVGLNDGTFVLKNDKLNQLCTTTGGYNLQKMVRNKKEYLLQSTYSAVVVYEKENGEWKFRNEMRGFIAPAPNLETDYLGNIWIRHSINGVFKLEHSDNLLEISSIESFFDKDQISPRCTHITKLENRVVFCSGEKLFVWDDLKRNIIPFSKLNQNLFGFESATKILFSKQNQYWFVKKKEIGLFEIFHGEAKLIYRLNSAKYRLNLVDEYENIISLNDSLSLICLDNGFALLNHNRLNKSENTAEPATIRRVICANSNNEQQELFLNESKKISLTNAWNNVQISFLSESYIGMPGLYQYKLDGLDKNWSEWNSGTTVNYTRLPTGTYKFYVRSQDSNGVSTNTTELIINVLPPWYNSKYFALVLVLLGVASSFVLRFYLKRKWKKQKQKLIQIEKNKIVQQQLESEQRIILLENEKLQNEIGHKNSQLASTTMAIISKNEVLNEIKTELEAFKVELGTRLPAKYLKKIYSLIDQNIAGENDWKVFENYFDQAHENFLQRLKLSFPDLTPGDLKLCAYLRMNLSSKEIAQLLNISIRGVEVHRYRLRKRLKLDSNSNLVEFLLNF